jgi:hypothetical protein
MEIQVEYFRILGITQIILNNAYSLFRKDNKSQNKIVF